MANYESLLNIHNIELSISHPMKDIAESCHQVIKDRDLQLGQRSCTSNWAVSSLPYNILLRRPWRRDVNPTIDPQKQTVFVNDEESQNETIKLS